MVFKIINCFCADIDATEAAEQTGLNRNTINLYFNNLRRLISEFQVKEKDKSVEDVHLEESCFGPDLVPGRYNKHKGGILSNKHPIFGLYERNGRIFSAKIHKRSAKKFKRYLRGQIKLTGIIQTEDWASYDGIADPADDKCLCINKSKQSAGNEIMAFWEFTKQRLKKFHGIKKNFDLHLKESEWRYNKSHDQLILELRQMLRNSPTLEKKSPSNKRGEIQKVNDNDVEEIYEEYDPFL